MIRHLKILGLAVVAILATTALSVSPASAASFTSSAAHTTLSATNIGSHFITQTPASLTCRKAVFNGTQSGTQVSSITLAAFYSECHYLGVNVTLSMGDCAYEFKANGEVAIVNNPYKAGSNCGTNRINWAGPGCKIEIGPQSGLKSVGYDNVAGGDITITTALSGIAYTESGFLCPGGNTTNGTYNPGHMTMNGGAANLTHDP